MEKLSASVVIVGSGIGGATTAYALAERGIDVLIIERGDFIPKEPENWSPQAIFLDQRYKPNETWIDENNKEFVPGVHYFVGGNSKVYGAALPRFRSQDFGRIKHLEGDSPEWPFTYEEIEKYYLAAEILYKVHGATGFDPTEPPRSAPFPYPAIPHEKYVNDLDERLRRLGLHPFPNSMGIDLGDQGKCIRCATCDGFVCKIDAKSDAESCALRAALATGKVKIITKSRVEKIILNKENNKVSHLLVVGENGDFEVTGKRFVISAGAVNSAALLLKSNVGNSSGLVGKNFMMHINSHIAAFNPFKRNNLIFQKTLSFNDWYFDGGNNYPLGAVQLIGRVNGLMMKSFAKRVPLKLLNFIANRSVEFVLMTEDLPVESNRIEISNSGKIQVFLNQVGKKTHSQLIKKSKRYLRRAGYIFIFRQPFDISMNSHQCGTLKAGNDPKNSVLNKYCQVHDVENLYVIDGGFFPSSAAMNPALTIAAQAFRVVAESPLTAGLN